MCACIPNAPYNNCMETNKCLFGSLSSSLSFVYFVGVGIQA